MLRRIRHPDIWRVYWTTLMLGLAYGIAISVISIYLNDIGFTPSEMGGLAFFFAAGIAALSLPAGFLVRRFTPKGVLLTAIGVYGASVVVLPFLQGYEAVAGARFVDGAASVCVWIASETFLLQRAGAKHKAFATSLYAVSLALGYILGPLLARGLAHALPLTYAFYAAGGLAALAMGYVWLRLGRGGHPAGPLPEDPSSEPPGPACREPAPEAAAELDAPPSSIPSVLWQIKASCLGTFAYGYFQASVVLFLPLFMIQERGIAKEQTILVTAFFAAGMVLFSNPAGQLGDRLGHLATMRWLAAVGALTIGAFYYLPSFWLMCAAVFVAGATLAAISPVSLALIGSSLPARDYERGTALYNAVYACGMLIGPRVSGEIYEQAGGAPLLHHLAVLWLAFVLFALVNRRDDPAYAAGRAPAAAVVNTAGDIATHQ